MKKHKRAEKHDRLNRLKYVYGIIRKGHSSLDLEKSTVSLKKSYIDSIDGLTSILQDLFDIGAITLKAENIDPSRTEQVSKRMEEAESIFNTLKSIIDSAKITKTLSYANDNAFDGGQVEDTCKKVFSVDRGDKLTEEEKRISQDTLMALDKRNLQNPYGKLNRSYLSVVGKIDYWNFNHMESQDVIYLVKKNLLRFEIDRKKLESEISYCERVFENSSKRNWTKLHLLIFFLQVVLQALYNIYDLKRGEPKSPIENVNTQKRNEKSIGDNYEDTSQQSQYYNLSEEVNQKYVLSEKNNGRDHSFNWFDGTSYSSSYKRNELDGFKGEVSQEAVPYGGESESFFEVGGRSSGSFLLYPLQGEEAKWH